MLRERVPEGGGGDRESSVPQGSVLGHGDGEEVCVGGTEGAGGSVRVEQVGEVGGGLVVEGFMGEKEEFKLNALANGEPVEVLEDRGDVITGAGVSEKAGGGVLDVL